MTIPWPSSTSIIYHLSSIIKKMGLVGDVRRPTANHFGVRGWCVGGYSSKPHPANNLHWAAYTCRLGNVCHEHQSARLYSRRHQQLYRRLSGHTMSHTKSHCDLHHSVGGTGTPVAVRCPHTSQHTMQPLTGSMVDGVPYRSRPPLWQTFFELLAPPSAFFVDYKAAR